MEKPVWAAEGRGRRADMTKEEFRKMVSSGPVILDGATGTNLFAAGMPHGVSTELWVLENPEVSRTIRRHDARMMEVNPTYSVVLLAGLTEDIASLFQKLNEFDCLFQYTRSGRVAVTRSKEERLSDLLEERQKG